MSLLASAAADPAAHALASVTRQDNVTGNTVDKTAIACEETARKRNPVGRVLNTTGAAPRERAWSRDPITIDGLNDSRVKPIGSGRFPLKVTEIGLTCVASGC